jgi:hypothetical protein
MPFHDRTRISPCGKKPKKNKHPVKDFFSAPVFRGSPGNSHKITLYLSREIQVLLKPVGFLNIVAGGFL